jgi:hypothetical protein
MNRGPDGRFVKRKKKPRPPGVPKDMPLQTCPCGRTCERYKKICEVCRNDSRQKARMQYQLSLIRWQERVEREAAEATKGLKAGEPLPPVAGESIINRWLREE